MFRSLRKAAQSLEKGMETAFSSAPASHTAFQGTILTIAGIKLKLGAVFAEGGYSFIHVATPVSSPSKTARYAVKRLSCADEEASRQAAREIAFLRQLPPHPNIVKFYDATHHAGHAFLLFELVDGGTLPEVLARSQPPPDRLLAIFGDAAAAVAHLHAQHPPVAMRDVKLENMLYDRLQGCYKLCDFGSVTTHAARPVTRKDILRAEDDVANNCTPMYRAPELVDLYAKMFICERVDVWALGCVWYVMLFGSLPFDGQSSLQIGKGLQHVPSEPVYPEEYIALLRGMLTVEPAKRLDSFLVLESVRRLQGREMDHELRQIGAQLRRRRAKDFHSSDEPPADFTDSQRPEFCIEPQPTPQPSIAKSAVPPSGDPVGMPAGTPPLATAAAAVGSGTHRNDWWADFDSAFGNPPPVNERTASKLSRTPAPGHKATPTPTVPAHAADSSSSLIDLSDLNITTPTPLTNARQNSYRKPQDDRTSAIDCGDLIDFG